MICRYEYLIIWIGILYYFFFLYKIFEASETMDMLAFYWRVMVICGDLGRGTVDFEQHVCMRGEDSSLKKREVTLQYILSTVANHRFTTGNKKIIIFIYLYWHIAHNTIIIWKHNILFCNIICPNFELSNKK